MVTFEAGVFAVDEPCSFTPPNTLPEGSLAFGGIWRSPKVYFSPYVYFSLFLCQLAVFIKPIHYQIERRRFVI